MPRIMMLPEDISLPLDTDTPGRFFYRLADVAIGLNIQRFTDRLSRWSPVLHAFPAQSRWRSPPFDLRRCAKVSLSSFRLRGQITPPDSATIPVSVIS
ncbi:Uncharacterised protein [Raoultella terrigena]|uniref:Uncharacterized protein n=1 Tax=Raoultella terrigena TaxID=577 RepID=A0A4U9D4L5_RAOTE|nr:Uncharacterised protein [Raoultella terrigena]